MSQADLEILHAGYEAIGRRDWDAVFRGFHPDFELKTPEHGTDASVVRGREAAGHAFRDFFQPYDEVHMDPQEIFDRGDRIVVFLVLRSRPRGSRAMVETRGAHLWTMRDGRPARLQIFTKREDALEAAGVT